MKNRALMLLTLLALPGCKKETAPTSEKANAPTPATEAPAATPVSGGTANPAETYCEVVIDGEAPVKYPGQVSSTHWGDEVETTAKIMCPSLNLVAFGDATEVPRGPGKYPLYKAGGPKTGVFAFFPAHKPFDVTGSVDISAWDETSITGSFEAKGSMGVKGAADFKESVTVRGKFKANKGASPHRPYTQGYCDLTVNGGLPERHGGGAFSLGTGHWKNPSGKTPSYPLQLNCGPYNFGANGELADFPMKAGTFKTDPNNAPGSISLLSPLANPETSLKIDSWDDKALKGSFEVKGPRSFSSDTTPVTVQAVFHFKR